MTDIYKTGDATYTLADKKIVLQLIDKFETLIFLRCNLNNHSQLVSVSKSEAKHFVDFALKYHGDEIYMWIDDDEHLIIFTYSKKD